MWVKSEKVSSLLKELAAKLVLEADALQEQAVTFKAENALMRQLGETQQQG